MVIDYVNSECKQFTIHISKRTHYWIPKILSLDDVLSADNDNHKIYQYENIFIIINIS